MRNFLWFVVGLIAGEFWSGWLMHIVYAAAIIALLWTGHHPNFYCRP